MDRDMQKKTGVDQLTPNQKIMLEKWLNDTFVVKTGEQKMEENTLTISLNIRNGQQLQLSDGSLWEINPEDSYTSSTWITPVELTIKKSNNPTYPFWLSNKATGQGVRARKMNPEEMFAPSPPAPMPPGAPSGVTAPTGPSGSTAPASP